jgi:hypothetical protein
LAIEEHGAYPGLLVVDTVARCMVGGDENSARDMGQFIENVSRFCEPYGAASLFIHHTGKNGVDERGSSALRGAADTVMAMRPEGSGLKLTCEKQKDAAEFDAIRLHLGSEGQSCVIEPGTPVGRLGSAEVVILEAVSAAFGTDWANASSIIDVSNMPRGSVYRHLQSLCIHGFVDIEPVGKHRKRYRLTAKGLAHVSNRLKPSQETDPNRLVSLPSLRRGVTEKVAAT